ncbi:MAG TPA: tetratricopeptide repeat protein, partial [Thermoanaerobaculia bacterium]|nr:tetratricopeptide repeat protein [Thermoanaerobaculia bacterium]
ELRRGGEARRSDSPPARAAAPLDERERVIAFWEAQRAGMDAIKRQGDLDAAIGHFRAALALDPEHGDARYYLANCLAARGDVEAGLAELAELRRIDPGSHRAHKQWGVLRAAHARSAGDLAAARAALERALELNREETGSLLALGELALLEGDLGAAERSLSLATRTNPRAVGGFFLLGWLALQRGDERAAGELLESAQAARGPEWKPEAAVAEGDVLTRMHVESGPLDAVWEGWDGGSDPTVAFAPLERLLEQRRRALAPR